MKHWLRFVRPGDWLLVLGAAAAVIASLPMLWQGGLGERAIVRLDGQVFADVDLQTRRTLTVRGPLGDTVIAVEPGRARVVSDPGLRQYCVRQGWLSRAGEIAICAPNHISLAITGRHRAYDSLTY